MDPGQFRKLHADPRQSGRPGEGEQVARHRPPSSVSWLGRLLFRDGLRRWRTYPRTPSTAFQDPAATRLGRSFGPAAEAHPGLSGFSLLVHGREAFIARLALANQA